MRYSDWGERAGRWAGIRSETVDVRGTNVHYLASEAAPVADTPVHVFVPNPAGSASAWLDVLAEMRPHGQVIAVDLPGTIAGHTASPNRRAAGVEASARFMRAFTDALGLDRVVVHGWSAGGVIALLFADDAPERVAGIVLVAPPLPPPLSTREAKVWRTVGRAVVAVVPPVARLMLRVLGPRLLDRKLKLLADPASIAGSKWDTGGDLTRISAEITELIHDELLAVSPKQLGSGVTMITSVIASMFVRPHRAQTAMTRVDAPTLLLWGNDDRLIVREFIDDWCAQRPDWELTVFDGVGHAPPLEVPADYAHAVDDWMTKLTIRSRGRHSRRPE